MRITPATGETLRSFWMLVEPALPAILDSSYQHVCSEPNLRSLLGDKIPHLKQAQTRHWQKMFAGRFDADYHEAVRKIGLIHHQIGLAPRWYIGGYNFVLEQLTDIAVRAHRFSPRKLQAVLAAMNTAVLLDMDIAISVYHEALLLEREHRGRKVEALLQSFEEKTAAVGMVAAAATDLRTTAEALSGTTDTTTQRATDVAAAVEQASVNVQEAASGTQHVSANIAGVSEGARETGAAAGRVLGAAGNLSGQAEQLRGDVRTFISDVKAA
jgi:hypothetical protein